VSMSSLRVSRRPLIQSAVSYSSAVREVAFLRVSDRLASVSGSRWLSVTAPDLLKDGVIQHYRKDLAVICGQNAPAKEVLPMVASNKALSRRRA